MKKAKRIKHELVNRSVKITAKPFRSHPVPRHAAPYCIRLYRIYRRPQGERFPDMANVDRRKLDLLVNTSVERRVGVEDQPLHHVLNRSGDRAHDSATPLFCVDPVLQDRRYGVVGLDPIRELVHHKGTMPVLRLRLPRQCLEERLPGRICHIGKTSEPF